MLTRHDQTIEDCLEVMEAIAPLGLRHIGFKDVGVDVATLKQLNERIKRSGATSYWGSPPGGRTSPSGRGPSPSRCFVVPLALCRRAGRVSMVPSRREAARRR